MNIVALSLVVAWSTTAWAASPFDGPWTVRQSCPTTADRVKGYAWTYSATVHDGFLTGVHQPNSPHDGSLRLTGQIDAAGSATLEAEGRTGDSDYAVGHVSPGYPVRYHVSARFTPSSGTGTRNEQRLCDFLFSRY